LTSDRGRRHTRTHLLSCFGALARVQFNSNSLPVFVRTLRHIWTSSTCKANNPGTTLFRITGLPQLGQCHPNNSKGQQTNSMSFRPASVRLTSHSISLASSLQFGRSLSRFPIYRRSSHDLTLFVPASIRSETTENGVQGTVIRRPRVK
jgi:hypothetical protein